MQETQKYVPCHVLYILISYISDSVATLFFDVIFDAHSIKNENEV